MPRINDPKLAAEYLKEDVDEMLASIEALEQQRKQTNAQIDERIAQFQAQLNRWQPLLEDDE